MHSKGKGDGRTSVKERGPGGATRRLREEVAGWVNRKSKNKVGHACTYGGNQRRSRVGSREGTDETAKATLFQIDFHMA